MNNSATTEEITFEKVLNLARQLPDVDQARLVARLAPRVEWVVNQVVADKASHHQKRLRGLLSDLGPAPSAQDIDEVQHEMWAYLT